MPRPPGPHPTSFKGIRSRPGTARIAGIELPIEEGLQHISIARQPGELFPPRTLKPFRPLSSAERARVAAYQRVRDEIREGSLFSVLLDDENGSDETRARRGEVVIADPFENGVGTYSRKYVPKKRTLPVFEGEGFDLTFFPRELWSVIDPKYAGRDHTRSVRRKHKRPKANESRLDAVVEKAVAEEQQQQRQQQQQHHHQHQPGSGGADVGRGPGLEGVSDAEAMSDDDDDDGGEGNVAEDQDDEFEEDEDDLAGDYNAEQYFDDGGDDAGDDYDGGDGGGGDDGLY